MALSISYVDAAGVAINWSTAVVNGVATTNIYSVTADDAHSNTFLWAPSGSPVTAAQVLAARADTVPAGGKARVGTLGSVSDVVNTGPGYSTRYLPTAAAAGTVRGAQNNGEGVILVDALGTETIDGGTNSSLIQPGETVQFQANGSGAWVRLSAANALLNGTYASKALANLAARAVPIGDSITYGSDNPANNNSRGLSWPMYAEMVSDGRFHYVRNAGISGNTTAQMLARFDTDVTPYAPTLVPIMGGRNDISQSVPLATYQANIIAIVAKIRAIGAVPWLFTITPTNSTGGQTTRAWNAWLRAYAATNGIPLTDAYEVVVDTTTGNYLSAYNSGDNTHPTEAGYYAIGSRFASDVGRIAASRAIPRLYDAADTLNIMQGSNPLFLTTTITSQAPSGFSLVNSGSVSGSMVTGDTTINGNWYRMTFAASASDVTLFHSGGFVTTAGRKYALTCLINSQLSAAPAGGGLFVQVGISPGTAYALYAGSTQSQKGRLWASFTAGGTSCNPQVFVKTGTTGTVDIAEWAIFDLTTARIDSLVA